MKGLRLGLGLSGATAKFNPASLFSGGAAGLLWDPSDISTLYQSGTRAAKGAAVASIGDPVGLLLDKSGNGNDLVQATSGSRPTYQVDSGGHPYLLFDGIDDFLALASFAIALPFDRLTALRQVSWTQGRNIWSGGINTAALNQNTASPSLHMISGNNSNTLENAGAAVGANALVVERHVAAASLLGVDNGALTGPVNVGSSAPTSLNLGSNSSGAQPANFRFYGAIIVPQMSAANLAAAKTWLGAKAGETL